MPNYLCISIDGLHSGMIGAYGNAWIHTPTFDSLACQSVLFDRFYVSSMDLSATMNEWWQLLPEHHKILLTDDTDVFLHEHAELFDEKHRLESKQRNRPAEKIEETQWFRNMATIADLLRNRSGQPFLLWAHFEGFRGCWDFPLAYRQRYQIDEDPDPYPDVTLPDFRGANIDPGVRQSVMEAYSGGISVLDETLAGLFAFLQKEGFGQNTLLLFTSVRGFSLGVHGFIGSNDDLYCENVHLPLFIRFPCGSFSGFRSQALLQPADVWEIVRKGEIPEEPTEVHRHLRIGQEVIVTPDWFVYQKSSGSELYVKPDDRWEVNNVVDRCPHVLEQIVSGME